jgi:hypothetical protein
VVRGPGVIHYCQENVTATQHRVLSTHLFTKTMVDKFDLNKYRAKIESNIRKDVTSDCILWTGATRTYKNGLSYGYINVVTPSAKKPPPMHVHRVWFCLNRGIKPWETKLHVSHL